MELIYRKYMEKRHLTPADFETLWVKVRAMAASYGDMSPGDEDELIADMKEKFVVPINPKL